VVLMDMGLPRCDGPTAVREIRRDPAYAGLRIFAVTGCAPEQFDLASGSAGIDRWFRKPLDPASLLHELKQELDATPLRGVTPPHNLSMSREAGQVARPPEGASWHGPGRW
jgi:CheY-like chemotaxis protein